MFNRYMKMVVVMIGIYAGSYALAMDQGAGAGTFIPEKTCTCCTDQKPLTDFRTLEDCLHAEYCCECWQNLVDDRIGRKDLGMIRCPFQQDSVRCPHRLSLRDITNVTGDASRARALEKIKREVIAGSIEQPISDPIIAGNQMCPCCGVEIEKNAGCNEVMCTHCALSSCWDCGRPYFETGGHLAFPKGHGYGAGYIAGSTACQKPSLLPGSSSMGLNEQLFATARYNLPYLARLLVARGADIDAVDGETYTSLMEAARCGYLPVVKSLVEKCHAKISEKDKEGFNAFAIAASAGRLPVVQYLVEECHVNIEEKDNKGMTALMLAAFQGQLPVVQYLAKECHANIEEKDDEGMTALMKAVFQGCLEVARYLIEKCHANVEEKNTKGYTALMLAAFSGWLPVVQYLVEECHANIEEKDDRGKTVLMKAVASNNLELVRYLVEKCHAHIEEKDTKGCTALTFAAYDGCLPLIRYFVEECYTNIEEKNKKVVSLLRYVAMRGHLEVVKYFVEECNANIEAQDARGYTALDFAISGHHAAVVKYLQDCADKIAAAKAGSLKGNTASADTTMDGEQSAKKRRDD